MCGRFVQITDPEQIKVSISDLEIDDAVRAKFAKHYNIAPTQEVLTVLNTPVPRLIFTHWGLVPYWAKDRQIGSRMINARSETLAKKPSFQEPFKKRRCIIFSDGFYEWKSVDKSRTPYFLHRKDGKLLAFAGLWDRWIDRATRETLISSTIITTDANPLVSEMHDRMPAILEEDCVRLWLSPEPQPEKALMDCLKPYPYNEMEAYSISRQVNDPRNDSSEIIKPIG